MFVNAYSGNILATMKAIGHGGSDRDLINKGRNWLANEVVQKALQSRYTYTVEQKKNIADKDDLLQWWTSIVQNKDEHDPEKGKIQLRDRIKASELIGKAHIMFGEKKDINHNVTITNVIESAYKLDDTDIEDIDYVEKREDEVAKELPMPELKEDKKKDKKKDVMEIFDGES